MRLLLLKESFYVIVVIMKKLLLLLFFCRLVISSIIYLHVRSWKIGILETMVYGDYISQNALGGLRHPLHQIRNLIDSLSVSRTTTHYLCLYRPCKYTTLHSIHSSCSSLLFFSMSYLELRVELKGMCCELIHWKDKCLDWQYSTIFL